MNPGLMGWSLGLMGRPIFQNQNSYEPWTDGREPGMYIIISIIRHMNRVACKQPSTQSSPTEQATAVRPQGRRDTGRRLAEGLTKPVCSMAGLERKAGS